MRRVGDDRSSPGRKPRQHQCRPAPQVGGLHHGAAQTLGANLSQVALQAALLFNAVYAQKVWNSGEADNEGGAA